MAEIYQNHVIDPTYFYDCIEEFSFNYNIFVVTGKTLDDYGNSVLTYTNQTIRGSLQCQGVNLSQSKKGNTDEMKYRFYCKSLYRIDIGDILTRFTSSLTIRFFTAFSALIGSLR